MSIDIEFESNIDEVVAKLSEGAKKGAEAAGSEAEGLVKEKISGPGSGKMYYVPGTGRQYQASLPYEPPAVRTGDLLGSYTHKVEKTWGGYQAVIGSPLFYAPMLEFGTSDMKPRPHLKPALKENLKHLQEIMASYIAEELDD